MSVIARLLCVALSGCYSFTVAGRARTVDRGHLELVAAPGVSGIAVANADTNVRPRGSIAARYGVTEQLELGARVGDSGAVASARVQLLRAPPDRIGIDLLVAPGLAYTLTDKLALELPIVAGVAFPCGHELFVAPRFVEQLRFGVGGLGHPAQFAFAGASLGFAYQLTPRVAIAPELGVLANVYSEPGFASFTAGGPALEGVVAILFDR